MRHSRAKTLQHSSCLCVCFVSALQDDLQQLRKAYDAFLERYPLCYGYWKKYAEAEKRHAADSAATDATAAAAAAATTTGGSVEAAAAVYQRGVAAVPHSAELWVAYAALLQGSDAPSDTVRG
jgi:pre-mRNA-processing factor 39